MPKSPKRIWHPRPAGLDPARTAPFWRGVTAEQLVAKRKRIRDRDKALKAKRKAPKGLTGSKKTARISFMWQHA